MPAPPVSYPLSRRARRPDAELLAETARGDLTALGELYDRYHADVWRVAHRLTAGSADVDDVVQATFLALPRLGASYDGRESCRGWLCAIAAGLAARQRRSLGRLLLRLASLGATAQSVWTNDPERDAGSREEMRMFERALAALAWKKREAFVLVDLEGVTVAEAARALGVPEPTVRTRCFHARRELRAAMRRGGAS